MFSMERLAFLDTILSFVKKVRGGRTCLEHRSEEWWNDGGVGVKGRMKQQQYSTKKLFYSDTRQLVCSPLACPIGELKYMKNGGHLSLERNEWNRNRTQNSLAQQMR